MEIYRTTLKNNTWSECKSVKEKKLNCCKRKLQNGYFTDDTLYILYIQTPTGFDACCFRIFECPRQFLDAGNLLLQSMLRTSSWSKYTLEKGCFFFQKKIWVLRNNRNVRSHTQVTLSLKISLQMLQAKSNIFLSSSLTETYNLFKGNGQYSRPKEFKKPTKSSLSVHICRRFGGLGLAQWVTVWTYC